MGIVYIIGFRCMLYTEHFRQQDIISKKQKQEVLKNEKKNHSLYSVLLYKLRTNRASRDAKKEVQQRDFRKMIHEIDRTPLINLS